MFLVCEGDSGPLVRTRLMMERKERTEEPQLLVGAGWGAD